MALVYSCCFWISLRLGGIIIALFSMIQAVLILIVFSILSKQVYEEKYNNINLITWINGINLIYMKKFITNFFEDPDTYNSYIITLFCLYILGCVLYIYGAYKLINIMMSAYIVLEFLRLITSSFFVITGLLILKENTMDIGLLIGMSVIGGFILLGMFYMWICAASLPVLNNEIKQNEQAILIETLQNLLEKKKTTNRFLYNDYNYSSSENMSHHQHSRKNIFIIPRNETHHTNVRF